MVVDGTPRFPYNPYDFSNPVAAKTLFVGRESELRDIGYYLDQARNAPRPINLALIGDRAAGKTSILNMIGLEAEDRTCTVVRIDLNEGDVESPLAFFFKVFHELFTVACETASTDVNGTEVRCFGGIHGRTYESYLDLVSMYSIPADKLWLPFIFPIQFAKAMSAGNTRAFVSEHDLKRDILEIRRQVNRPIILLFDECNVLANKAVILEMLRNVFMNLPGFMLVLTGTPAFFPTMDDVFSPIIRQFKKIEIGGFKTAGETERCIRRPLEQFGRDAEHHVMQLNSAEIEEIHEVTGGRPYEINLVCHFMFKQVQLGQAKAMRLDITVLDDVLRELGTAQDVQSRPIISRVALLDRPQLEKLATFTRASSLTFQDVWFGEYVLRSADQSTHHELKERLDIFVERGILKVQDDRVAFAGDELDRIYIKYMARSKKVNLFYPGADLSAWFRVELNRVARKLLPAPLSLTFVVPAALTGGQEERDPIPAEMSLSQLSTALRTSGAPIRLFTLENTYRRLFATYRKGSKSVTVWLLNVRSQNADAGVLLIADDSNAREDSEFDAFIETITDRAKSLDGAFTISDHTVRVLPPAEMMESLASGLTDNERKDFVLSVSRYHSEILREYYLQENDIDKALEHIRESIPLASEPSLANNIGYILLSAGRFVEAKQVFDMAGKSSNDSCLLEFNRGVVEWQLGNSVAAAEHFQKSISMSDGQDNRAVCLWVLEKDQDGLRVVEKRGDLDAATEAKLALLLVREACP